jgi:AraC-like DNA-binding protein
MWQTIGSSAFARHGHEHAYAAVVLSGGYEEAGDHGRFNVNAGDVVMHEHFEAHINRFTASGAVVLNLAIAPGTCFLPGLARVADTDSVVRLAEKSQTDAASFLLSSITKTESEHGDWPDELALALVANPSLSLSRWSECKGLTPWAISRGFMQVFGITPVAFRARTRARRAWKAITTGEDALATIAANLGFADQSHMTRSVKHITGMTPQMCRAAANRFKTPRV